MSAKRDNPELRLHCVILDYLRLVLPREARDTLIHVPNGEKRTPETGALLKRMGTRPGVEDLQFLYQSRVYAVEVKPEGRYQRPVQRERQAAVLRAGGFYAVCRSTNDVRELLSHWGVATREVAA